MLRLNEIVYSLNVEDIQTVALEHLERELTIDEIEKIKNLIGEKIPWFDAIAEAIDEGLEDISSKQ
jgi:hypothetical protein